MLPGHVHVGAHEPGHELAAGGEVLLVHAAQHVHAEARAVDLVAVAALEHVARLGAGVALRAVLHRQHERLQRVLVAVREQLLEAVQEREDERLFLFLRLRALERVERDEAVERGAVLFGPCGLRLFERRLEAVLIVGRGKRRELVERGQDRDVVRHVARAQLLVLLGHGAIPPTYRTSWDGCAEPTRRHARGARPRGPSPRPPCCPRRWDRCPTAPCGRRRTCPRSGSSW